MNKWIFLVILVYYHIIHLTRKQLIEYKYFFVLYMYVYDFNIKNKDTGSVTRVVKTFEILKKKKKNYLMFSEISNYGYFWNPLTACSESLFKIRFLFY